MNVFTIIGLYLSFNIVAANSSPVVHEFTSTIFFSPETQVTLDFFILLLYRHNKQIRQHCDGDFDTQNEQQQS